MALIPWIAAAFVLASGGVIVRQRRKAALDDRDAERAADELGTLAARSPDRFDVAMVRDLPEPARRFFAFAIEPGTPLTSVVEITMRGQLSLSSKADPKYQEMSARQLLAAPHGFVWRVEVGRAPMRVSGSDGMTGDRSWTRFWLLRCIPLVRVGGDVDHLRSSFARMVAEAAFWSPAFLLPRPGVAWSAVDSDTARVTVANRSLTQTLDIRVAAKPADVGEHAEMEQCERGEDVPDPAVRRRPLGLPHGLGIPASLSRRRRQLLRHRRLLPVLQGTGRRCSLC